MFVNMLILLLLDQQYCTKLLVVVLFATPTRFFVFFSRNGGLPTSCAK